MSLELTDVGAPQVTRFPTGSLEVWIAIRSVFGLVGWAGAPEGSPDRTGAPHAAARAAAATSSTRCRWVLIVIAEHDCLLIGKRALGYPELNAHLGRPDADFAWVEDRRANRGGQLSGVEDRWDHGPTQRHDALRSGLFDERAHDLRRPLEHDRAQRRDLFGSRNIVEAERANVAHVAHEPVTVEQIAREDVVAIER